MFCKAAVCYNWKMLPAPVAVGLAVLLVLALFFATRAGKPAGENRTAAGAERRPAFSVEALGLLVLLALLLAALWILR